MRGIVNHLRRGMTLIETLVVIAVVSVLMGVLIVGLRQVRERGRDAVVSSDLRTHAQVMNSYPVDHRGAYPHFTERGLFSYELTGGGMSTVVSYFDAHRTWHIALADGYYDSNAMSDVFFPPEYRVEGGYWPMFTGYSYPCVFITGHEYWNVTTRIGPEQWRETRAAEVSYPAAKALVVDTWTYAGRVSDVGDLLREKLSVGFCDGSARRVDVRERYNGYERGDGYIFRDDGTVHFIDSPPMLHTIDGVRGRDVQ